ncbi:uncharacterized protein palmdb isoform X2 [Osmerus eperlanus]|uniref:uncharacterized protein palmdb isoform X2 n=1 Tax=Osmerus eperlanus TaxID=29151 RepID=UPI002E13648D
MLWTLSLRGVGVSGRFWVPHWDDCVAGLKMISFWRICFRLLRATAVVRGTDESGARESCSSPENLNPNKPRSDAEVVAMETSEQPEVAKVTDCEEELALSESPEKHSAEDEQVGPDADCLDSQGKKATLHILKELPTGSIEIEELEGLGNGHRPCQREALILDTGREELNRNESINSSVSDTLSSADSVYENEAHRKRQDTQEQDQVDEPLASPEEDTTSVHTAEPYVCEDDACDPMGEDVPEESILEQYIREEALSDVSNEEYPEELDECLRVEIAAASSDSDGDDKWRAIFSSSINREDDDSYLDGLQLSAQELFVQKVEVNNMQNHADGYPGDEDPETDQEEGGVVVEQPDDVNYNGTPTQEVIFDALTLHNLSQNADSDKEEKPNNTHPHPHHATGDPNKKMPKDFCVIQETKSENVSTEHVDFQLARRQWLEMEEQTKNQVLSPTSKTPTFHGSHSFMYTPVRNIDRPKKDPSLENLPLLGDYPHTQFSPCSEDSGLDDSSYRSPYDDPETPMEKEIRLAMEREESFRKERGFSKTFRTTESPQVRIPKSPSAPLTPSFIITSSPAKASLDDMAGSNVVILEPGDDDYPASPRHGGSARTLSARTGEWRSDESHSSSSNLIILETSKLIVRSASEFCLNKASGEEQPQEKGFLQNPFFKLRSRSTLSLVDEEIKMVKQREEELRRERAGMYTKTGLVTPNMMDSLSFENSVDVPMKCKSSPSSPMKTPYKMDRSALSCDHRFPEVYTGGRRKSAMALRWEAGEFANNDD